ncbi:hypothetical protein [Curtobacterium sp. BRB10]|uniref:hypothetical protein n=1 Tax=Curtobacterium sp. BRB10 TaxID=2962579 RepID=UPI00288236BF|nr:hypothetical protein [Curtobacterium sp. BRB10]MDT0234907.1 hypothetical protein [Curtobacterium sp. BRB10]
MTLDAATLARTQRALHDYSKSERIQDRDAASDALSELVVIAEIEGDVSLSRLQEAWEWLSLGFESAGEAARIVDGVASDQSR